MLYSLQMTICIPTIDLTLEAEVIQGYQNDPVRR